jgi:hypothetical protein
MGSVSSGGWYHPVSREQPAHDFMVPTFTRSKTRWVKRATMSEALTAEHRSTWWAYSQMRVVHITTRSVLLRQPQYSDYLMEETHARTSSRVLDTVVHHRGSFQLHMEPCLRGHQLQCDECIRRWLDSPVETRWRTGRKALGG